jgi:two-component sensor histidine kinase
MHNAFSLGHVKWSRALLGGAFSGVILIFMGLGPWVLPASALAFLAVASLTSAMEHPSTVAAAALAGRVRRHLRRAVAMPFSLRVAVALALTLSAVAVNLGLDADPRDHAYLSIAGPVIVSGLFFGFEIGAVALFIACIANLYFFIPPRFDMATDKIEDLEHLLEFILFVASSAWCLRSMFEDLVPAPGAAHASALGPGLEGKSLREVHEQNRELRHRVRNEFQALSLLASSEAQRSGESEIFRRWVMRLRGVASLHELVDGEARDRVSLARYIAALTEALRKTYDGVLTIDTQVDASVEVDFDRARRIGLIYAEATMNALKHGFAGRAGGRLEVGLRRVGERLELSVVDDGKGFDPAKTTPGFGLGVMRDFADVLNGELTVESRPQGTSVRCVFPSV